MVSRPPQRGFNHNIQYQARIYHVQTEDSGIDNPQIFSHLFFGGQIIASAHTDYSDLLSEPAFEKKVRKIMQEQHKQLMKQLRHGKFDEKITALVEASQEAPVTTPIEQEEIPMFAGSDTICETLTEEDLVALGSDTISDTEFHQEQPHQKTDSGLQQPVSKKQLPQQESEPAIQLGTKDVLLDISTDDLLEQAIGGTDRYPSTEVMTASPQSQVQQPPTPSHITRPRDISQSNVLPPVSQNRQTILPQTHKLLSSSPTRYVAPTRKRTRKKRATDNYNLPQRQVPPTQMQVEQPQRTAPYDANNPSFRAKPKISGVYSLIDHSKKTSAPVDKKAENPIIIVDRPPSKDQTQQKPTSAQNVPQTQPLLKNKTQTNKHTRPTTLPDIFGSDLITERSLDEVILGYLAEDVQTDDKDKDKKNKK